MPRASRISALVLLVLAGCARSDEAPLGRDAQRTLVTPADSLAARIEQAAGGAAAFAALPALRFDFAVVADTVETSRRRHLWDRTTGRYRLEWSAGDSLLVALFSVNDVASGRPAGGVYHEGIRLDSADAAGRLEQAFGRFINDSYWLLAPLKLFDPGVSRQVAPDSGDAQSEVLALSFDGVGLTPGDRYWMRASRSTGRLQSWHYELEGGSAGDYRWLDPQEIAGPAGTLHLDRRKARRAGGRSILTLAIRGIVEEGSFTDPMPRLTPLQ